MTRIFMLQKQHGIDSKCVVVHSGIRKNLAYIHTRTLLSLCCADAIDCCGDDDPVGYKGQNMCQYMRNYTVCGLTKQPSRSKDEFSSVDILASQGNATDGIGSFAR